MPLDLSNDYKVFDGTRAVMLVEVGTSQQQSVADSLRRQVSATEAQASAGAYTQQDVKWNLPKVNVTLFKAAVGDLIVDGDDTWVTVKLDDATLETRNRHWCKKTALNEDLDELVSVLKRTTGRDPSGAPTVNWVPLKQGLKAKIQEAMSEIIVRHGRREVKATHGIYILEPPAELAAGMRVRDADDVDYTVLRVTGKDALGALTVIDAVVANTPLED